MIGVVPYAALRFAAYDGAHHDVTMVDPDSSIFAIAVSHCLLLLTSVIWHLA